MGSSCSSALCNGRAKKKQRQNLKHTLRLRSTFFFYGQPLYPTAVLKPFSFYLSKAFSKVGMSLVGLVEDHVIRKTPLQTERQKYLGTVATIKLLENNQIEMTLHEY
ncbi:hypothetical protein TNCV_3534141 [Trichonephila clavipes]|nr:hypothetical protein TNCV_3534141 [Trichonephila clavipes]